MTVMGNVTFDGSRASRCTLRTTRPRRGVGTRSLLPGAFDLRLPPNFRITALDRRADLQQVPIGVAQVDRDDRPGRAGALHWPLFDGDAVLAQPRDRRLRRVVGEKAE